MDKKIDEKGLLDDLENRKKIDSKILKTDVKNRINFQENRPPKPQKKAIKITSFQSLNKYELHQVTTKTFLKLQAMEKHLQAFRNTLNTFQGTVSSLLRTRMEVLSHPPMKYQIS
jgi:hypothetical protein